MLLPTPFLMEGFTLNTTDAVDHAKKLVVVEPKLLILVQNLQDQAPIQFL